jgi:hypothetical protein
MVRQHDWKIMELLISVKLFKSGLNGQNIDAIFVDVLRSLPLNLSLWQFFAIVGQAGTNMKCMNNICDHHEVLADPM